jgi:peptidoglycan L-alanyl-D-glutamate endopeptidase CwlK
MSGGSPESLVSRDMTLLAPRFTKAIEAALAECKSKGLDAYVYEAYRSNELQAMYYARGRTVIPPEKPVTNAPNNLLSWHGYGLAVDVISRARRWDQPREWFEEVAEVLKRFEVKWGGDWTKPDLPHFQWGKCKPSPSDFARQLIGAEGMQAVWKVVGAD